MKLRQIYTKAITYLACPISSTRDYGGSEARKGHELPAGSSHTTPKKFENGVIFLRLGQPSTLIPHEKAS